MTDILTDIKILIEINKDLKSSGPGHYSNMKEMYLHLPRYQDKNIQDRVKELFPNTRIRFWQ